MIYNLFLHNINMFSKYLKTATIKRQTYATSGWYTKGGYIAVSWLFKGHLRPATDKDGIENRAFGKDYIFTTSDTSDIKEGDKVTIDWVEYNCQWMSSYWGLTFNKKNCLLKLADDWN